VKSWHGGLRPGIDLDKANQLLDEMDSQDFVEKFLK